MFLAKTINLDMPEELKGQTSTRVFVSTSSNPKLDRTYKFERYTNCDKLGILDMILLSDQVCLAVAGVSKKIYIYNSDSLKLIKTLSGHTDRVNALCQISKKLVSGSNDRTIRIWGEKAEEVKIPTTYSVKNLYAVTSEIFLTWDESDIKVWSFSKREMIFNVGQKSRISRVCFHDHYAIASYMDGTSRYIDLMNGSVLKSWNIERSAYLESQTFLSSTRVLFSCLSGFKLFDIEEEKVIQEIPKEETNYSIHETYITPTGLLLAGCSLHNLIRIWNLKNPFDGNYLLGVYHGHSDNIRNFVPLSGNRVATSSWDGNIIIWRLPSLVEFTSSDFNAQFKDLHFQFI